MAEAKDKSKSKDHWMKDAAESIKHPGICTGSKLGSASCPVGSRQYALAMEFKKGSETASANAKKRKESK